VELLAAVVPDWVVFARPGGYPADEAYFLHFIVHTIGEGRCKVIPPGCSAICRLDRNDATDKSSEAKSMVYIAHQLDFLGRLPERR